MRLIFMGTPEFSVPALAALKKAGHEIAAVYTRAPRKAGRGMALRRSPVHEFALQSGFEVLCPQNFKNPEDITNFAALRADVAVVVAYGLILPKAILDAPVRGCFNIHASLLPRWRGAAPIQRAIMAGDDQSGISIMRMDEGLDTGPVCLVEKIDIGPDMNASGLHDALSICGAGAIVTALDLEERGALRCTSQSLQGVNYAAKISKSEARINWKLGADEVHNHIRALAPFPGAWCNMGDGDAVQRVKILRSRRAAARGVPGEVLDEHLTIACGSGAVVLEKLQRAGGKAVAAADFLRGFNLKPGYILG